MAGVHGDCWVTSLLVVGAVSLLLYWMWKHYQHFQTFKRLGIPGPKPSFILGNIREINKEGFCDAFIGLNKKFGDCYGIYIASSPPSVVFHNKDILRELCVKQFSKFSNRMPMTIMDYKPFSHNLLQLRDDHWKHVRSVLSPTFSSGKLKKITPAIDRVVDNLDKHVRKIAESGEMVELRDLAGSFSIDTIAGAAFGMQVDSLANPDEQFSTMGKIFIDTRLFPLFMLFPWLGPILWKIGIGVFSKKSVNYFLNVLELALKDRRTDTAKHADFLQLLVDMEKEGGAQGPVDEEIDHSGHLDTSKAWTRKGLNDDEIKANAVIFLMAGYDTIAIVMSFTLFLLAANPDCLRKVQKETDDRVGQGRVTYDKAMELTYLDMCINEAIRLFPPGFMLDREASEDLELGGYRVEKGMRMIIPAYALHRDPRTFPDPDKFHPERHTPEAKAARHPFSFLPFGLGPRNCIGQRLALLEMRLALATVLHRYTPVLCDKSVYPPKLAGNQTRIVSQDGLWVKFKLRK